MKGPWLCLMGTSLLFGLLWPFSFVYAFFPSLMKLVLGLSVFRRQKDKLKMSRVDAAVGSCSVSLISCFGWVSFLPECPLTHSDEIELPRDALCSFSWEETFVRVSVTGVLPCEPGIFCPSRYSSAAGRMAEACGLMTLSGRWVGAGVAWVGNEWRPVCRVKGGPEPQGCGGTEEGVIKQ